MIVESYLNYMLLFLLYEVVCRCKFLGKTFFSKKGGDE